MYTTVCSKCGTGLAAGAVFCPSCGQAVAASSTPPRPAPAPAAGGKKGAPFVVLAVLGGGLVVLLGALALYKSGLLAGSGRPADPVTPTPVAQAEPSPAADNPASIPAALPPPTAPAPGVLGTPVPAAPVEPSSAARPPVTPPPVTAPSGTVAPAAKVPSEDAPPPPPPFSKTYECRESAVFNVSPEDAIVTIDGKEIGTADDWDDMGGGKKYKFKDEGVHYVKLSLEDYKTVWLRFIVSSKADDKTADVDLELKEGKGDKEAKDEDDEKEKKPEKKKDKKDKEEKK